MKNVNEVQILALADEIYTKIISDGVLPGGFYIGRDEIISEIILDLNYLDGIYVPGPASFRTYAKNFCPKRVIGKIWAQYRKIEKYTVIEEELDDDGQASRQYGVYETGPLTTEPDYAGIEARDIIDGLLPEDRIIIKERLDGRTQQEIADKLGVS